MSQFHQSEQEEACRAVSGYLGQLSEKNLRRLKDDCREYLEFRKRVDGFLQEHFSRICTQKCYQSRLSACCTRDGIVVFFADVVVNVLFSEAHDVQSFLSTIGKENTETQCVYLGPSGCRWKIKPIVCTMFLCDRAKHDVLDQDPALREIWEALEKKRKRFTWPDRPVLFDDLERFFLDAGYTSPLMHLHNSPGLLRVKKNANFQ